MTKELILELYNKGTHNQNELAAMYYAYRRAVDKKYTETQASVLVTRWLLEANRRKA